VSGRDARRARQRKAEQRRHEAGKARVGAVLAYLNAAEAAERRIMARLSEHRELANLRTIFAGGYIDGASPFRWQPEIITAQELHEARDAAERATNAAFHQRRNLFR